jgi:hypothetical protein
MIPSPWRRVFLILGLVAAFFWILPIAVVTALGWGSVWVFTPYDAGYSVLSCVFILLSIVDDVKALLADS